MMFNTKSFPIALLHSLVRILSLVTAVPISSFLDNDTPQDSRAMIGVQVKLADNHVFDMTDEGKIFRLRKTIEDMYPIELHDDPVILNINGTTLNLVHSTLLIPGSLSMKIRNRKERDEYIYLNNMSSFDNQPFCMMQTADISVSGVFNLCNGLNGYYTEGKILYNVFARINSTLKHFLSITNLKKEMGNYSRLFSNTILSSWNDITTRRKRSGEKYYVELYVVADFDFWIRECVDKDYNTRALCFHEVWTYLYPVSTLYYYVFNIHIVVVGIEIWNGGNFADIPIYKVASTGDLANGRLNDEIKEWAEREVKPHTNFDTFLYLTRTSRWKSEFLGTAHVGGLCQYSPTMYVDAYSPDEVTIITIAHELGHIFGANHVETSECRCKGELCIMDVALSDRDKKQKERTLFSHCTIKTIKETLASSPCLKNAPVYGTPWQRCGNGIVDPEEECEFNTNSPCCGLDCKLKGTHQCTEGECCDVSSCSFKQHGTVCRERSGDCDFTDVCTGKAADCPVDRWRLDGTSCHNHGWSFCYQGRCTTHNALCTKIFVDPKAKSANEVCYDHKGSIRGKVTNAGDKFCAEVLCSVSTRTPRSAYNLVRAEYLNVYDSRGDHVHRYTSFTGGLIWYEDLKTIPDGARCGPNHICKKRSCVPLAPISAMCDKCLGYRQGCDQNSMCICEWGAECNSTGSGRATPSSDIAESWDVQLGLQAGGGVLEQWVTESAADSRASKENVTYSTIPGKVIGIPILCLGLIWLTLVVMYVTRRRVYRSRPVRIAK